MVLETLHSVNAYILPALESRHCILRIDILAVAYDIHKLLSSPVEV